MEIETCRVCDGSGEIEGIKCMFCGGRGYYGVKSQEVEYQDPPCGEITEFDA